MARGAITLNTLDSYGGSDTSLTWTAADATNDHTFVNDGKTFLLYWSENAATCDIEIVGVASSRTANNATTDTITIPIGSVTTQIGMAGPFPKAAFNQSTGVVNVNVELTPDVQLAAVKYNKSPNG